MLKNLQVRNYALIKELSIDFYQGFSIITGETGAGKSILLDAFSLILGERADTSVIHSGTDKCMVEARFEIGEYDLGIFFENNDIEYSDETIIRREIYSNGKSRAFINDTPVNLNQLKELCINLVDIHSQHENLQLSNFLFQLRAIDSVADTKDLLLKYKQVFQQYKVVEKEYEITVQKANQTKADFDYFTFQFNQLDAAKFKVGEQEECEKELDVLNHSEEIKINLSRSVELLNAEGLSIISNLKEIQQNLVKIAAYSDPMAEALKRIESTYIELKDLARELENLDEKIEHDPDRIKSLSERLDLLYSLQQKHRVASVSDLIRLRDDYKFKINEIESFDSTIDALKKQKESMHGGLINLSDELTKKRVSAIPSLEKEISALLQQLGMPHAKFSISNQKLEEFTIHGSDEIVFMFSANRHVPVQELSKIASGGEMSRLMLSLKYIISLNLSLPTLVLDEIDMGVSGEIAGKMANIMQDMSGHMQVINITHLPQIASKGKHHYKVFKSESDKTTSTHIKLLTNDERVVEIAKMLSGEQLTEAAISNAKELMAL